MARPAGGQTNSAVFSASSRVGARFRRVARTTLPQEIVRELINQIELGTLRPGDSLPSERELSEQFGVGRTSVREALKALALVGIVEVRPGDGTFIANPDTTGLLRPLAWRMMLSPSRVLEVVRARVLIESELAAQAAVHQNEQAIGEICTRLDEMVAATLAEPFDPARYLSADLAFHLMIARAAQNSVLGEILIALRSLLQSFIERSLELEGQPAALLATRHHREIYEAIRGGDGDAARRAMAHHIESKGHRLIAALAQSESGTPITNATIPDSR